MEGYERHYKKLLIIPLVLLLLSIGVIVQTVANTGTFVNKGVSLSGGVSATVTLTEVVDPNTIRQGLQIEFPQSDAVVRTVNQGSGQLGLLIDASDINEDPQVAAELLRAHLESSLPASSVSVETTGPSLGQAFFIQTITGILLAFAWMGWVVFMYFGKSRNLKIIMAIVNVILTILVLQSVLGGFVGAAILAVLVFISMIFYFWKSVPSGAVILAAGSTILFTVAVINLIGLRLSTAGIAAFLMLIGYSVDTDILLSTRVLRSKHGTPAKRLWGAFKTGITMQLTTTAAVLASLLLTTSEVIGQIMLILFIGLIGDIIFTWFQNAGILYWHVKSLPAEEQVEAPKAKKRSRPRGKRKWKK